MEGEAYAEIARRAVARARAAILSINSMTKIYEKSQQKLSQLIDIFAWMLYKIYTFLHSELELDEKMRIATSF